MKFEIELDEVKIYEMVVAKIYETIGYQVRERVEKVVKDELRHAIRYRANEHIDALLKDFTLPDGRTFKEYLTALVMSPGGEKRIPWSERPKLVALAEERLWRETESLFREIAQPQIDDLKNKIRTTLIDKILA